MHVCDLSILRTVRLIAKEANYEGKEDAWRLGTPDWARAPHPISSTLGISGKAQTHLCLGDPIWGGGFLTSCISIALFSLSSSQQLRDLLRQNNVAYSSDDLLIIYQAPLESRSPGTQMKNSRQHVLTRS